MNTTKVNGTFSGGHAASWTWAETPFKVKWAYTRLVILAEVSRFVCRILGLPPMTEYKLGNGCCWSRTDKEGSD